VVLKLPRTIRLDPSDAAVFDAAAPAGEWAVSGAFAFLDAEGAADLTGKARQAFANGFLGVGSFGWSTLVVVSEATEAEAAEVVEKLAAHFVARYGAPDLDAARPVAREEVDFAAGLCAHPVNTLLAVQRKFGPDGIRESFRVIEPRREKQHAPIWSIMPDDDEDANQ
jgi:hypothetical protein